MKTLFYYFVFMLVVFTSVSHSLQKMTKSDCNTLGSQSLACKQLEKENLINQLLK